MRSRDPHVPRYGPEDVYPLFIPVFNCSNSKRANTAESQCSKVVITLLTVRTVPRRLLHPSHLQPAGRVVGKVYAPCTATGVLSTKRWMEKSRRTL